MTSSNSGLKSSKQHYLSSMIDGLRFLARYDKQFKKEMDLDSYERFFKAKMQPSELNESFNQLIMQTANAYVQRADTSIIQHQCHAFAHGFWNAYQSFPYAERMPIYITIGNIYYKGHNVYGLSRSKLKQIMARGKDLESSLDVHVWITLNNMMVVDLTALTSLKAKGFDIEAEAKEVLLWNPDEPGDFHFEPLLVDNDFMLRVDEVHTYY